MMEIKFRAWNGFKMIYKFFISAEGQIFLDKNPRGVDMSNVTGIYPPNYNHYTIMQFTGRHDCQGIEIYEKDVCEFDNEIWQIEYGGDGSYYILSETRMIPLHEIASDEIKKIGNRFENPELLKGE